MADRSPPKAYYQSRVFIHLYQYTFVLAEKWWLLNQTDTSTNHEKKKALEIYMRMYHKEWHDGLLRYMGDVIRGQLYFDMCIEFFTPL